MRSAPPLLVVRPAPARTLDAMRIPVSAALALALLAACGQPDATRSPTVLARDDADDAPAEQAPPGAEPESVAGAPPCAPAEARGLDTARIVELALAAIREASPDAPSACLDPVPTCAAEADGTRCVYRLSLHPGVIRVTIWPRAADGALVEAEAFVARDLTATVAPARVRAHRWAVGGPIRCRGESTPRSYGGAEAGPVTGTRLGLTCWSAAASARPLRATRVHLLGARPAEAEVTASEPSALAPGAPTPVSVTFAPIPLALRTDNGLQVTLQIGEHTLRPVAQIVTSERHAR